MKKKDLELIKKLKENATKYSYLAEYYHHKGIIRDRKLQLAKNEMCKNIRDNVLKLKKGDYIMKSTIVIEFDSECGELIAIKGRNKLIYKHGSLMLADILNDAYYDVFNVFASKANRVVKARKKTKKKSDIIDKRS